MEHLSTWDGFFENRQLGVAFFDGLSFETDRLTDPRWDRVLPVLEEEQILQCRLMKGLLKKLVDRNSKPPKVLDLGTGCGVFAIYAAMLGCEVDAIDISQRAVNFTRQNLQTNQGKLKDSGTVNIILGDYCRLNSAGDCDEKYDVIIVAPPYNPTAQCCRPALHADGGTDGQAKFLELLKIVPRMLKFGGICLGNHMFTVEGKEFRDRELYRRYLSGFELQYVRILDEDILARTFVESQYRSFFKVRQTADAMKNYVSLFTPETRFGYAYFELTKTNTADSLIVKESSHLAFESGWSWDRRIDLHRTIVECSRHYGAIPAEDFLADVRSVPDLIDLQMDESQQDEDSHEIPWQESVLYPIDRWLDNCGIFEHETGVSFVLVDSAPWYPTTNNPAAFRQDCAVWVRDDARLSESRGTIPHLAEEILTAYQNNTQALQESRLGTVFHPCFTGKAEPGHWRDIQFTSLNRLADEKSSEDFLQRKGSEYAQLIAKEYCDNTLRPSFKESKFRPDSRSKAIIRRASAQLSELKSPLDASVFEQAANKRIQEMREGGHTFFRNLAENELLQLDLSCCHIAMHKHMREVIEPLLLKYSKDGAECSFLAALPVTIANFDAPMVLGTIPGSFRGGIWIYVVCDKPWSIDLERKVKHLCRASHLVADAKYTNLMSAEVRKSEATSNQMQFSHTVQSQVRLLKPAVNQSLEHHIREPAQVALRRLQFAVNLFSPTRFNRLKSQTPFPWTQIFSDAAIMTRVRLKARSAFGVSKLIDVAACRATQSPDTTNERILHNLEKLLQDWSKSESAMLKALGVENAADEMNRTNLVASWDDDAECGLITYLVEQALFHGAVFLSGISELNIRDKEKRPVVITDWDSTSSELTISNRVLSNKFSYSSTTDYSTIENVITKFGKEIRFQFTLDDLWFKASLVFGNRKESQ
jgi:methylase of polypeptide subunit release factors